MSKDLMIDTLKIFPDIYKMIEFVTKLITGEISPNVDDWAFIAQIDKYEKYGIFVDDQASGRNIYE